MFRKFLIVMGLCSGALLVFIGVLTFLGSQIDAKHQSVVSKDLPFPKDFVWTLISNVREIPRWNPIVQRVEVISHEPLSWQEHYASGQVVTYQITAAEPPHKLVRIATDKEVPITGEWTFELATTAEGTTVTITERATIENALIRFIAHKVMGIDSFQQQYLEMLRQGATAQKHVNASEDQETL